MREKIVCEIDEAAEIKEYKRDLNWLDLCKKDFNGWCKRSESASKDARKVSFFDISFVLH